MGKPALKKLASELFESAGIQVNGNNPWDIRVLNEDFYSRIFKDGSLGFGESYMDQWWECQNLDIFFEKLFVANRQAKSKINISLLIEMFWLKVLKIRFINIQSKKRSLEVCKKHYDLGNELFQHMLDSRMNYSCGYWKNAENLEQAQLNKLELTCQKLMLKPGMRLLDIGCGFGGLARYAAEKFGVEVVGVTLSKKQYEFAKQYCMGLPIEIRVQDYRELKGQFDRIVSIGMFEHVGYQNYLQYFEIVKQCLKKEGLFLLHTIGCNKTYYTGDPWFDKYIFPNGFVPSILHIAKAAEGGMVMEDWHNFGADYDKTLMAWHHNFNEHWDDLKQNYDERFRRMWNYYLLFCAGRFRTRQLQLWQIVFSNGGLKGGYQRPAAPA